MSERYRTIAFLSYPENQPLDNLLDKIKESHIPAFVSPLHSPDEKHSKPHYHVLLMFDTQRGVNYLHDLVLSLGGANGFFITPPKRQYARYLVHLDDPDKEQFTESVIALNGADFRPYLFQSEEIENSADLYCVLRFIGDNNIVNFRQLVQALGSDYDALSVVRKNVLFFNLYLKS